MATLPERKAKSKMKQEHPHNEYQMGWVESSMEIAASDHAENKRQQEYESLPDGLGFFVAECGGPFAYDWEIDGDLVKFNGENIIVEEGKPEPGSRPGTFYPTVVITFYVNGSTLELPQCPEGAADTIERYLNQ